MVLSLDNIACTRGGLRVLEGVSFSLLPGCAMLLQGPNGIGKTTLLRTIAGLQRPVSGTIRVDAECVAYAGHADGVKSTLTVAENLSFWAAVFGTRSITPALEALHLASLAGRPAGSLSAGQRRRLGLARLLVTGRSIWLLDEPTVSLDAAASALFATMIAHHLSRGGSALIASHVDIDLPGCRVLDLTPFASRRATAVAAFDGVTA